ncbi:MAG: terminase large subunit [Proteobacteria bacterium]|nr:terminase large subunit [Pseudomonadota bacterium]
MKPIVPWIFDNSEIPDPFGYGERAVEFLRRLKHPKNPARGHPFQLDPWQERIVRRIYGPRHDDGRRIVETVMLLLPRGNRKTSLAAALALLHTIGPERLPGGEVVFAAADKKQAGIGFREALSIARADKRVNAAVKVSDAVNSTKRITLKSDGTFLETLSSDAETQHGRTPTFAFVDELHAHKKSDLWGAIRSGLPKTKGSLLIIATTAGKGQENLAYELVAYARKVARGKIVNPAFLPILFEPDANADWQDEALWYAVNPGLAHGYPSIEGLQRLALEAKDRPGDREDFKQYHLNMWRDQSTNPFVEMTVYDEGSAPVDLGDLKDRPCWLGVDLSSSGDLTVVVSAWKDDDGFIVWPWFFCPAENLSERESQSGAPYVRWAKEGLIKPTPGNVVDFRAVEATIRDLCAEYDVQEIAFDPALARNVLNNLLDDGFPAVEMRQGALTMMPAITELERAIVGRKLQHGGHPILRWNFENVEVQTNTYGHKVRLAKGLRHLCIDGAVATAMAVCRAASGSSETSFLNNAAISAADLAW